MSATATRSRKLVTALVVALALVSALTSAGCSEREAARFGIGALLLVLTGDERSERKHRQRVCELTGQDCEPFRTGSGREEESW